MRFYTHQHRFYCGIDLHARTMFLCIMDQSGKILLHRNYPANPAVLLRTIGPYREDIAVAVECIFTYNLPSFEKRIDRRSNRAGIGVRFTDPTVCTSVEVDVALMDAIHEQIFTP
jgi:hypothetical protein